MSKQDEYNERMRQRTAEVNVTRERQEAKRQEKINRRKLERGNK